MYKGKNLYMSVYAYIYGSLCVYEVCMSICGSVCVFVLMKVCVCLCLYIF